MKNPKLIAGMILAAALVTFAPSSHAEGTNSVAPSSGAKGTNTVAAAIKPDLLTTCPVSGDKLGGDMGKPVVIVYKGQEVKFCCASCKEDFDKDPAKYMAKIRAADKPAKK